MNLACTIPTADVWIDEIATQDVYRIGEACRGVVVDLGANIGIFTLRALELGAERVVSVEPLPSNLEALRENVAAAGCADRVTIVEAAIVGWHREIAMVCTGAQAFVEHGPSADWMRRALGQEGPAPRVASVTLADLWQTHGMTRVSFLKVDVEGLEFEALCAAPHDLLATVDRIAIETDPAPPGAFGALVEHLAHTHHVETLGVPQRGGYIWARRYNL